MPRYAQCNTYYAIASLLIVAAFYVSALFSLPPDALTQHDTGAKYLQVRNLRITPAGLDWSINYPARSLDPDLRFVPFRAKQHAINGGRIYLQWPIFLGLLTRIPWKLFGFWGLYVVPMLAGLGTLWATYRLALKMSVPPRYAWLAIPILGLATPISIYSLLFFEHTLAALLVTCSLLASVGALRAYSRQAIWLNAALLAAAIYFRSELYVLALATGIVYLSMAWRDPAWRRRLFEWATAFIVALLPLWLFYAINEGTILPLHAIWYFAGSEGSGSPAGGPARAGVGGLELPAVRYIASAGWRVVPDFLFGPQTFPSSPRFPFWSEALGMLGLALCAIPAAIKLFRLRFQSRSLHTATLATGLCLVALPSLFALLSGEQYYNLHGFLLASPFVALALWPTGDKTAQPHEKSRPVTPEGWLQAVTLLYIGIHALVISVLSGLGPISRHEWGQRYLLPAYPALVALSLLAISHILSGRRRDDRDDKVEMRRAWAISLGVAVALVLVGTLLSVRGYLAMQNERTQVVAWQNMARILPDREPLVTDIWWLTLNLAPDFYTRPIMLAEGDIRLREWATQMQAQGVTHFALMTNNPTTLSGAWLQASPNVHPETAPPRQANGMWLQRYTIAAAR